MAEPLGRQLLEQATRRVLFPAPRLDPGILDEVAELVGAERVLLRAVDGVGLYGWYRACEQPGERALLFFHGNAETVLDRLALQDLVLELGWDFFMVAYRGYPGSEGTPTESGLRLDAQAAWNHLTLDRGIPRERLVVHGKSLGGGVAAALVSDHAPAGLVLESTFTSIADVARWRVPFVARDRLKQWISHHFETAKRAPGIPCPTLILHGDDDRVVPVDHGRALAPLFPRGQYIELVGVGHGESIPVVEPRARTAYLQFLEDVA